MYSTHTNMGNRKENTLRNCSMQTNKQKNIESENKQHWRHREIFSNSVPTNYVVIFMSNLEPLAVSMLPSSRFSTCRFFFFILPIHLRPQTCHALATGLTIERRARCRFHSFNKVAPIFAPLIESSRILLPCRAFAALLSALNYRLKVGSWRSRNFHKIVTQNKRMAAGWAQTSALWRLPVATLLVGENWTFGTDPYILGRFRLKEPHPEYVRLWRLFLFFFVGNVNIIGGARALIDEQTSRFEIIKNYCTSF